MNDRLRIAAQLHPGQDLVSFLSQLAWRNGVDRTRDFCFDFELDLGRLRGGCAEEIARLAVLADVPAERLSAEVVATVSGSPILRGQRLSKGSLRLNGQAVCPHCLEDDIAASDRPYHEAAHFRTIWRLSAIRTCPVHGVAIREHFGIRPDLRHDPVLFLQKSFRQIVRPLVRPDCRPVSPLERYLLDRIEGRSGSTPFLDGMEFHVVARFCEALGRVIEGQSSKASETDDDRLYEAGAVGFEVACGGEDALTAALSELQSRAALNGASGHSLGTPFGELYRLLLATKDQPAFDGLRDVVKRHVEQTAPFIPGSMFLGQTLHTPRVQSVHTVALSTGLHPLRLRKILAAHGLVEKAGPTSWDSKTRFDASEARVVLDKLTDSMSLRKAAIYLNIPEKRLRALISIGFIKPALKGNEIDTVSRHSFKSTDLDSALQNLLKTAVVVKNQKTNMLTIFQGAKRYARIYTDIFSLVWEQKLPWVGQLKDVQGISSIVIRASDLEEYYDIRSDADPTVKQVTKQTPAKYPVINLALETDLVKYYIAKHPMKWTEERYVVRSSLNEYLSEYISDYEISKLLRRSRSSIQPFLRNRNVEPVAIDSKCAIYRRADVKAHISRSAA